MLQVEGDARSAARAYEDQQGGKGLFGWAENGTLAPVAFPEKPGADLPWLLFIHGTASSTRGSFGKIAECQPRIWARLHAMYPGRVIAFEHRTLTEDPVQNALELLAALPRGIQLHVVSHSRGGLVGELLVRPQLVAAVGDTVFDADDLAHFDGDPGQEALKALGTALAGRGVRVTRFVRVACPARGTSLAGGRLDRWLNLLFDLIRLGGVWLGEDHRRQVEQLRRFALAASASAENPEALPGIAAMSPDHAPLLRLLDRQQAGGGADGLVVIGGDSEPAGIRRKLMLWFADAFFGRDNDLVVDTASMDGGMRRARMAPVLIDRGRHVDHFSYFANQTTAEFMLQGLRDPLRLPTGTRTATQRLCETETPEITRGEDGAAIRAPAAPAILRGRGAPLAVILPGIAGSHLYADDRHVWLNPAGICTRGVRALAYSRPRIRPTVTIQTYYAGLRRHLERTHTVKALAYDWRLPIQRTGAHLAQMMQGWMAEDDQRPVHVVAHSMGGLVARMAFVHAPKLMQGFLAHRDSRLLMLGTPNGGSLAMALTLLGIGTTIKAAAALSPRESVADIAAIMRAWPGAIQLLPRDMLNPAAWANLAGAAPPDPQAMAEARRFWDLMKGDAGIPRGRCLYLAGAGETCDRIFTVQGRKGPELRLSKTSDGDGTVLWSTGIPDGVQAWYSRSEHGDLAKDRYLHPAIAELLLTGTTRQLPTRPRPRGAEDVAPLRRTMAEEPLPMIPSPPQMLALAMGARSPAISDDEELADTIRVRVVHGDLRRARYPILVGHYLGDPIMGAEAALDRMLGNRLSRRNARGLHPGLIGTWDVQITPDCETGQAAPVALKGGVTVGLGVVSDLTTGGLIETLRSGLMAFADTAQQLGWDRQQPLAISLVLVGCGAGVVAVSDSVAAILTAIAQANRLLGEDSPRPGQSLRFGEVEIIEGVEQTAITAWHAVRNRTQRLAERFELAGRLEQGQGGWRRTGPEIDPDWWMEVTITSPDPAGHHPGLPHPAWPQRDAPLRYLLVDGRARVEAEVVATSRRLVSHYIAQIPAESGLADVSGLSPGRTLFELLWPAKLKEHSLEDRNLRLVLDRRSAAIPWEMLDDRRPGQDAFDEGVLMATKPPAVRYGVLRQLISQRQRPARPRRGGGRFALVIGDPRGGGSPLAPLPGAEREAEAVAALLEEAGYSVMRLIGEAARPQDVVSAMYSRSWDVIHVAGHGVADWAPTPADPPRTGIVLGAPPLDVLEAELLAQLPSAPDFVFLNCCYLGQIGPRDQHLLQDRPGLAASLAVELIESGCSAVVACGWAVDDGAALNFARTLYAELCGGTNFGQSVRRAREATHAASTGAGFMDSTWGAYQCYGHPGFALASNGGAQGAAEPEPASPGEAIAILQSIRSRAEADPDADPDAALARLAAIEEDLRLCGWDGHSDVASALGDAWLACGRLDKAIAAYQRAAMAENLSLPVRALQDCFGLPLRLRGAATDVAGLKDAVTILAALNMACGASVQRLDLIAAIHQRIAALSASGGWTQPVKAMQAALAEAIRLAQERGQQEPFDLQLRAALAGFLLDPKGDHGATVAGIRQRLAPAVPPLLELVEALLAGDGEGLDRLAQSAAVAPPDDLWALAEAVDLARNCLPARSALQKHLKALSAAIEQLS
ncbi:hypothetical protein C9E82_12025 [Paracoccus siganidrum]|nr:hypothetical protein C9E82_12025 [Paracoccus siganidrum]